MQWGPPDISGTRTHRICPKKGLEPGDGVSRLWCGEGSGEVVGAKSQVASADCSGEMASRCERQTGYTDRGRGGESRRATEWVWF